MHDHDSWSSQYGQKYIRNTRINGQLLLVMEHNIIKEFNTEYQGTDPYILLRGLRWIKYRNACIRTSTTREYTWEN